MYYSENWRKAGYTQKKRLNHYTVYLWNPIDKTTSLYVKNHYYAGYTVQIGKFRYEFVRTVYGVRYCDEHQTWEEK